MNKEVKLVDFEELFIEDPDASDIPCACCKAKVKEGDFVAVEIEDGEFSELTWVIVEASYDGSFIGTVCGPIGFSRKHGIGRGDFIPFEACHIYTICFAEEEDLAELAED